MSQITSYYVYALKDPRSNPVLPFYIGKGTGNRAWDHVLNVDESAKGKRIRAIEVAGMKVVVSKMADGLTEAQALKLEAELISSFGTEATGGFLTNVVTPSGKPKRVRRDLRVPSGVVEKANIGLDLLKEAVVELAKANVGGITNADCAKALGLQSNYGGGAKDYLSYSLLGLLIEEGRLQRNDTLGKGRHISILK
ncbi:GIY-YIG nuclease family protein [Ruegeria arenilitoris]|uniref:GIY-YIG nuclease family protein n=1 Tax=Ruegeria arenilitoris TaxID=1173585 RepID=UPI001C2C6EA6|nr:GIY-YIG nuclease family protein [Ruegeria arenilitoris]